MSQISIPSREQVYKHKSKMEESILREALKRKVTNLEKKKEMGWTDKKRLLVYKSQNEQYTKKEVNSYMKNSLKI